MRAARCAECQQVLEMVCGVMQRAARARYGVWKVCVVGGSVVLGENASRA